MQNINNQFFLFIFLTFTSLVLTVPTLAANPACKSQDVNKAFYEASHAYGPYDYTNAEDRARKLPIVESSHFTPEVENLIRGVSGKVFSDLDYTLRAFPNHHRALYAFSKYELRELKKMKQQRLYKPLTSRFGFPGTAECYFERAIYWRPNDPVVHLLYGIFLHLSGSLDTALKEYKVSEKIQPNSADLQYNLGLLYFDRKEYAIAKEHAIKAYKLGYPLPGLRKKLSSIGYWP